MLQCPVTRMRKHCGFVSVAVPAGILILLLATLAVSAPAADPAVAARAVELAGRVSVVRNGELWAVLGTAPVQPGETIVTGPDGHAIFQLADGSKFEVFPDSKVVFRDNRGNWRDLLDIYLGKVKIEIQKLGGRPNPYRVNSPTALIAVRGTVFEVSVAGDETTTVAVEEGLVSVSHKLHPSEVQVGPGETITVRPAEPLVPPGIGKARLAARIISTALDHALETIRTGGPGGGSRPPAAGGTPAPGGGTGGDMGQAPGPKDPGGDDSGSNAPGSSLPAPPGQSGSSSPVGSLPPPPAAGGSTSPAPAPTTPAPAPSPSSKRRTGTRGR